MKQHNSDIIKLMKIIKHDEIQCSVTLLEPLADLTSKNISVCFSKTFELRCYKFLESAMQTNYAGSKINAPNVQEVII